MSAPAVVTAPRRALRPVERDLTASLDGSRARELLCEVSHDLRSPLTSILALAESLRDGRPGPVNEAQHRQLGLISSAALSLCETASDLTELARDGNGLADPVTAPFSICDTLLAVRDMVMPMAEEKGLTVDVDYPAVD